ncbi:hypothetical protein CERZMDRAFT_103198 [Cercospora zeae-maydis SCOH1-5]|uniref:Uncharacterized protein n=1 Tax=Cercospora zeae-maydis SCOH1-5 TaxID=717836 RepID=A0A6A6F2Y4_9PEZI|nr:hypothetical protein CERZMDRAFT_103198 [Cercospora zeae-maydis SCOH1-5]
MFAIFNLKSTFSGIVPETNCQHAEPESGALGPLPPIAFAAPMYAGCAVYTQPGRPIYFPKVNQVQRTRRAHDQKARPITPRKSPKILCLRQSASDFDLESGLQSSSDADSKTEAEDGLLKEGGSDAESEETQWEQIKALFFTCPIFFVIFTLAKLHDPREIIKRYRLYAGPHGDDEGGR